MFKVCQLPHLQLATLSGYALAYTKQIHSLCFLLSLSNTLHFLSLYSSFSHSHKHTHTHTHAHARTHTQSKASSSHAKHSYCCPVNQHWDVCAPLRNLSLVQENPPGAELVTRRRNVQVSWREVTEPKVPQYLNTTKRDKDSWGICFPSLHQVPIDATAGWAVSPVDTSPPGPRWVYWSNVSKVSCSRKQQQHQSGSTGN